MELVRLAKNGKFNPNIKVMPIKPHIVPFKHQVGAFLCSVFLNRIAFFMEPGTGKTLPMIANLGYRYLHDQCKRALIFCPLTIASEIERQFEEFANYPYKIHMLAGMPGSKKQEFFRNFQDSVGLQIIIMNYESSWDRKSKTHGFDKNLKKWKPQVLVCDESQRLKNGNSTQTKAIRNIAKQCNIVYRLLMSGTPMAESPLDIFGQYKVLDEGIFGMSFTSFKERYSIPNPFSRFGIRGYQRLKELGLKVHRISYQALKADCLDLPPISERILQVELEPSAMAIYKQMEKKFLVELKNPKVILSATLIITQQMLLAQMTGGFVKYHGEVEGTQQISSAKMNACMDKVSSLCYNNKERKIVVFARYRAEIDAITTGINKLGISAKALCGQTKQKERKKLIYDFQNNKAPVVLVIQPDTGGEGITLTAADSSIFYSRDYKNGSYNQAISRMERIGQENKMTVYHIVAKDTIDLKIAQALCDKQDTVNMLISMYDQSLKKGRDEKVKRYQQYPFEIVFPKTSIKLHLPLGNPQEPVIHTGTPQVIEDTADLDEVMKDMQRELDRAPADRVNLFDRQQPKEKKGKKTPRNSDGTQSSKQSKPTKTDKPRSHEPVELTGDTITLKQIGDEINAEPRKIRQWLRKEGIETKSGKWVWEKDDPQIQDIIDRFPG